MTRIHYSPRAQKQLQSLSRKVAQRIAKRMRWFSEQDDPLSFAKKLKDPAYGTWRFRIGDYRVICDIENRMVQIIRVVSIKHRKEVYKDK